MTANVKVTLGLMCIDMPIYLMNSMHSYITVFFICFWTVFPCTLVGKVFLYTRDMIKRKPFLRRGIARYFWCMSLFANKFPQSQNATRENRNHFPPSGVPWIYKRCRAIYSSAWQREKRVCISTQLYTSDGVENVKSYELWIFILRTNRKQCICLADYWVHINPLPLFYHL